MPAQPADRLPVAGGGVHPGDPARLCQPCARLPRRVRRRDAGGAAAVRPGAAAGDAAGVPRALFRDPVHASPSRSWARASSGSTSWSPGRSAAGWREAARTANLPSWRRRWSRARRCARPANAVRPQPVQALEVAVVSGHVMLVSAAYSLISAPTVTSNAGHDPLVLRSIVPQCCSRERLLLAGPLRRCAGARRRAAAQDRRPPMQIQLGSAQPLPPVPRGARLPAPCRDHARTAASSPPSSRWSCRARAAAGRATWSTGSASISGPRQRALHPRQRQGKLSHADRPSDHRAPDRRGAGRRHLRLVVRRRRRAAAIDLRLRRAGQSARPLRPARRSPPSTSRAAPDAPQQISTEIQVRDILIAGLGDSIASGEGNPDRPIALSDEGFCFRSYLGDRRRRNITGRAAPATRAAAPARRRTRLQNWQRYGALWLNAACHRSLYSYQTRTALALAVQYPHIAVTYLPLACTGATIADGLFGTPARPRMPADQVDASCQAGVNGQLAELREALDGREEAPAGPHSSISCCCRSAPTTSISPASSPTSSSTPQPSARCSAAPA